MAGQCPEGTVSRVCNDAIYFTVLNFAHTYLAHRIISHEYHSIVHMAGIY